MKKPMLLTSLILASLFIPPISKVWPVVCVNCGTEWTQIANNIQLGTQYAEQLRQTINQVKMIDDQLKNTQRLGQGNWGDTFDQLNTLSRLAKKGEAIAYSASDLTTELNEKFNGYEHWQRDISPQEFEQNYKTMSKTLSDSASASLHVANGMHKQRAENEALMRTLERQSQGAGGRMEAIQAGNQISAQIVRHLQKIETLLSSQIQMTAAFMKTEVEKEQLAAAQEAQFKQGVYPKRGERTLERFQLIK